MNRLDIVQNIILGKSKTNMDFKDSLRDELFKELDKRNKFIYKINMNKSIFIFFSLFIILGGGYLVYKTVLEDKPSETVNTDNNDNQNTDNTGIANPASTYCIEQGGTIKIEDEEDGQVGYCYFDDGSKCEEWSFFRGECEK